MDIANLKPGAIVKTAFGVAVVADVMRSEATDAVTIYVKFARSIGRTHPDGDALRVTPDDLRGVDTWEAGRVWDLQEAINRRLNEVNVEATSLLRLVADNL